MEIMASKEEYNVKWDTFSDHLQDMLKDIITANELTDVTLVCDDKEQLQAHRIVLSASSVVFKSIIKDLSIVNPVIFLRGINYKEMKSILEFMYVGSTTVDHESVNEFLNVAKTLDLKEFSENVALFQTETNNYTTNHEPVDVKNEKSKTDDGIKKRKIYPKECPDCKKEFRSNQHMKSHFQAIHEGVRVHCDQCSFNATQNSTLRNHIQSKHKGIKFSCHECDFHATRQDSLRLHIEAKHRGINYLCDHDKCDYKASNKNLLKAHIQAKHNGVMFVCNDCDYRATQQRSLKKHVMSKHT